jgi:HK97 family phage prohead protease
MAKLSSGERSALPDSAFAYVEPGKPKIGGKTEDKYRHFPIHDKAHAANALSRIGQGARFGDKAKAAVMAAAKKHGIDKDADAGRSLESLYPEIRFYPDKLEMRTEQDQKHIVGYASVFNAVSRRLGGFHEKVLPTAFNRAKEENWPNVVCRYNHKDDFVLGTTGADTVRLKIDERGLQYDVIPPECRSDVMEYVERGDVRYSSFAFRCVDEDGDSWEKSEYNLPMRSLHTVELVDVAPVMDPAYRDTTAMARNMRGAVESLARWVDEDPDEVRSIMEAGQAIRFFKRTDRPSAPALDKDSAEQRVACDDLAVALRRSPWTAFEERITSVLDEDGKISDDLGKPADAPITDKTVDDVTAEDVADKTEDEVLADDEADDLALSRAFLDEFDARGPIDLG